MARRVATPSQLYKLNRAGLLALREEKGSEIPYPGAWAAIQSLEGGDSEGWADLNRKMDGLAGVEVAAELLRPTVRKQRSTS